MNVNNSLTNGVIVAGGVTAGAVAGNYLHKTATNKAITALGTEADYVKGRINANYDKIRDSYNSLTQVNKSIKKVGDKAVQDFRAMQAEIMEKAGKTKNKWIIGAAAAGLGLAGIVVMIKNGMTPKA